MWEKPAVLRQSKSLLSLVPLLMWGWKGWGGEGIERG